MKRINALILQIIEEAALERRSKDMIDINVVSLLDIARQHAEKG